MTRVALAFLLSLLLPAAAVAGGSGPDTVRVNWKFKTGGFVDSVPAHSGNLVFAGSWDHRFYAIDARTGTSAWSVDTGDFVDSAPLADGGKVFLASWNRLVRCLDARDGRELWRFEMPPSAFDDHRQSSPAPAGANVLIGGFDGTLYALDRESGRKAWELSTGGPIRSRPEPSGFVGSEDGFLYAFDPQTGALRWRTGVGSPILGAPAAASGNVWFGCRNGIVYGADADNGAVAWRYDTASRIEYSAPLVVEGMLFIGDCSGTLHAVRLSDRKAAWTRRVGGPIYSSPVIAGGSLVVGDNAGGISFLDPATGIVRALFNAGGPVQAIAAGPDGSVLCGSRDGHVYRLTLSGADVLPGSRAGGPIDNAVVWEGTVLVETMVQVLPAGRLTIRPGAEIRFSKGTGLAVSGALHAAGTADNPIRFSSAEPVPAPGDWTGILLAGPAGGVVLRHAAVADAEAIRVGSGDPEISRCAIERGLTGIAVGKDAAPRISGNAISDMRHHGIDCSMGAAPLIDNNVIRRCANSGIQSQRNAFPAATGNRISECNSGILYASPAPSPERNRLDNNVVGIALNNVGIEMAVSRNRFTGNGCGLRIENFSSPRVEGNDFDGNEVGIFCFRSSSPEVVRNRIVGNREGIACSQMSAPRIAANEIAGNRTGVMLTLSAYARVNGNNFDNNAVHMKLDNMSHDWEVRVGRKPERGGFARGLTQFERGKSLPPSDGDFKDESVVGADRVDASGNWWGGKDTAEMGNKGPDANIGSLVDGHDVPIRTYEGYPGEYAQDTIDYGGWKSAPITGAGIPENDR